MRKCRAHLLRLLLVVCTLLSCTSLAGSMCISCQSVAYLESGSCGEGFTPLSSQMCDGRGTSSYFCDDVSPWGSMKGRKLLNEQQPEPQLQQQQAAEAVPTGSSSTEQAVKGGISSTGSKAAAGAVDSSHALASGYYRRKYRHYHQNGRGGGSTRGGYCSSAGRRLAQAATESQQTAEPASSGAVTAAEQQAQASLILVGDRVSYNGDKSYVTYGYDYGRPQLCQITQGYRTSSGYLCGCLCIKQAPPIPPTPPPTPAVSPIPPVVTSPVPPNPIPSPSPSPAAPPTTCKLPDDVFGQPCKSPPTKLPPNIDEDSVTSCDNTASGTFCWASCAIGYLASSAPLQSQCCNRQWLQWKGGNCTAGSPCLSPPAFEPENVASIEGCVNKTSGEECVASCAENFTDDGQPPTAVCDNGDWTDWIGSCVPGISDNSTEGNVTEGNITEGNSTVQRGTPKASLPNASTTKPSRVQLCPTDQLPLAPAGSTGWVCARSTATNKAQGPGTLPTLSDITLAQDKKQKRQQQQQQPNAALADLLVTLPGHKRQHRTPRQQMQPAAQKQVELQQALSCTAQCWSAGAGGAAVTVVCMDGKWGKPHGKC